MRNGSTVQPKIDVANLLDEIRGQFFFHFKMAALCSSVIGWFFTRARKKTLTKESQLKKYYSLFFGQAESNCLFDHKEVFDYNLTLILKSMFSTHSYGFFKSPMEVHRLSKDNFQNGKFYP